jgi:16S rRNA processing protein RimM
MEVLTDFPERLIPGTTLYLGPAHQPAILLSRRWHKENLLVAFEGYPGREQVAVLRNQLVQVRADDRPLLPEGEYYHHQLIGLQVLDEAGNILGKLVEILVTGANDVYVVRGSAGKEILLPAIESVILDVNLERGLMKVYLLPGILPET